MILFGEHAVVYNIVAVAGSLSDLRIYVTTVRLSIDIIMILDSSIVIENYIVILILL